VENDVPPTVAAMIMACLSKNPEQRPQSARAVAEWIGLKESRALPTTSFAAPILPPPTQSVTAKESKKTTAGAAPAAPADEPPAGGSNATRRRLTMLAGATGLGLLAWLGWSFFMPKLPNTPGPASAPGTNGVQSTTNGNRAVPAAASPSSVITVSIELGETNHEVGLRQVAGSNFGITTPANIDDKECRLLPAHKNARCYFQILPAFKRPEAMNARIQVEYYAAATGTLQVKFDGTAKETPHYTNGGKISFEGEGEWKTANYQINDALFRGGETGGADFCLTATCPELYIHSVTVFFDE